MPTLLHPLDHTHDPAARSWLASANSLDTDFPIQNLPFGVLRRVASHEPWRGAVAIGDQAIDLAALQAAAPFDGLAAQGLAAASGPRLNALMACEPAVWRALRHALFAALREGAPAAQRQAVQAALLPLAGIEHTVPALIGDYTDFFTSIHHVRNAGRMFNPDVADPVGANFRSLPIAYHGRASSVVVGGTPVRRPWGQLPTGAKAGGATTRHAPSAKLDYELELALWLGGANAQGDAVTIDQAEARLFGVGLLNDWSARDVQSWEMAPLGPFLAKNFATSVSPWIVTLDALAPFRCAWGREAADGAPLAYLDSAEQRSAGGFDIALEALLLTPARRAAGGEPVLLAATNFHHQYWTPAQMVAHHSMGGCNLQAGDLLGSGTISGPTPEEAGALLELSQGGRQPLTLPVAEGRTEQRSFLQDGDELTLSAACQAPGAVRIALGSCTGRVLAAHPVN